VALGVGTSLRELPGVGPARGRGLEKLGLRSVGDLLRCAPRAYEDRRRSYTFRDAPEGVPVCVAAMVAEPARYSYVRKGMELVKVRLVDETAAATATFFNQNYTKDVLRVGERYIFYGKVERAGRRRRLTNPAFEREDKKRFTGRIMPVYALTRGISNNLVAGLALRCVEECAGQVEEVLPAALRREYQLPTAEFACRNIHFPADEQALDVARRRAVFEELFCLSCGLSMLRRQRERQAGPVFSTVPMEEFLALLPFSLTGAQRRALEEIAVDTALGGRMNRLVQGDVGSGKTILAFLALVMCAANGCQGAMMAPTEVLARQHYESLMKMNREYDLHLHPVLLTGSVGARDRREIYARIESGEADVVIGTHALIQEKVAYRSLALVITDEQHRFGVRQRESLAKKGGLSENEKNIHVLVMSATPIPRTLAIILYGDLHISVLDEMPADRLPIKNCVVNTSYRNTAYKFIEKEVGQGRQVYVICPLVEEGESPELEDVASYAKKLKSALPETVRIGILHGRMRPAQKNRVMEDFEAHNIDVLVSTTVIEVGINVPNATVMLVENAERFGLAQLHQLRGRVGRGDKQSYCIFISKSQNAHTMDRLKILNESNDGFYIAGKDLSLRGPGDLFGIRQSGDMRFTLGDIYRDASILQRASEWADRVLTEDRNLDGPEYAVLREALSEQEINEVDFRSI